MAESIYKTHKPSNGNDLYLKLKDGDKVKLRIVSPPAVSTYDGKKLRYNWIVWNRELNKPQIYNAGISVFTQLADIYEDWGEPDSYDITIKRTGSGQFDTEYSVTPVKTSTDLDEYQVKEVELIDLPQACNGKWLADYEKDHIMPEQILDDQPASGPVIEDIDETIDPMPGHSSIPF